MTGNMGSEKHGAPSDRCQFTFDTMCLTGDWCGKPPVYQITNWAGKTFVACAEHTLWARMANASASNKITSVRLLAVNAAQAS